MQVFAPFILAMVAAGQLPAPLRAGLMINVSGSSVLAMEGPGLLPGAVVTLVTVNDPQQVQRVLISRPLAHSEAMAKHDMRGPYYEVTPQSSSKALPDLAVAVLGRPNFQRIGTAVALRVGNPPVSVRVRSCTSSEGLHLTLWDGEPLKGTMLWHDYYYLGFDVEPTCQPADYRDSG